MKWLTRGGLYRQVTQRDNSTARKRIIRAFWDQVGRDEFVQEQQLTKTELKGEGHYPD